MFNGKKRLPCGLPSFFPFLISFYLLIFYVRVVSQGGRSSALPLCPTFCWQICLYCCLNILQLYRCSHLIQALARSLVMLNHPDSNPSPIQPLHQTMGRPLVLFYDIHCRPTNSKVFLKTPFEKECALKTQRYQKQLSKVFKNERHF